MRPLYEDEFDLGREEKFSRLVAEKFHCTFRKLPIRYGLDFAAERDGKVVSFVEVKTRNVGVTTYPTFMLSVSKFMAADALTRTTGLPCFLAVGWQSMWGYIPMNGKPPGDVAMGGRTDRGDSQDVEPVFLIPTSTFTLVPYL